MNLKNENKLIKQFDEDHLLKLVEFHKTGGIVYSNNEKLQFLTGKISEKIKDIYIKNLYKNSVYLEFYEKIKRDFPMLIPLKGIYFLQNIYKEDLGIRYMSDIDILLKNIDAIEFIDHLVSKYNFIKPEKKEVEKFRKLRSHIRVYGEYKKVPIELEVHWQPFEIPLPLQDEDYSEPFLMSTIHIIFHYYIWRLYHFTEWTYLYEKKHDENRLTELGFSKNIEYLRSLMKKFDNIEAFPYPYNKIIRKMGTLTKFQRFYFWFFIERRLKTNPKYFFNFIRREILW